jgi:hypothetical protein
MAKHLYNKETLELFSKKLHLLKLAIRDHVILYYNYKQSLK